MRAVVACGTPLINDPNRLAGVDTLGVDEHVWVHTSATRRTGYATEGGDVRLRPGHLPSADINRGPVRLSGLDCNGQSRLKLSPLPVAKTSVYEASRALLDVTVGIYAAGCTVDAAASHGRPDRAGPKTRVAVRLRKA